MNYEYPSKVLISSGKTCGRSHQLRKRWLMGLPSMDCGLGGPSSIVLGRSVNRVTPRS